MSHLLAKKITKDELNKYNHSKLEVKKGMGMDDGMLTCTIQLLYVQWLLMIINSFFF